MDTKVFNGEIGSAPDIILQGGLVAVPTETVYGLAADGLNESAVKMIYEVKGRPESKPLSLMVSGPEDIDTLCMEVSEAARYLADVFWPGPLTIVLKAKPGIPDIVLAGGSTLGLRCPAHPLTLKLIKESGKPLAAPSANPSGGKSPVEASQVLQYFDGRINGVIDGGKCGLGKESTIIDMSKFPYSIIREGALSKEDISLALTASLTIIGITGGTGCGKTTALETIEEMGGLVIDCDEVYHSLMSGSNDMMAAINQRFPGAVPEGTHDTKLLGEIVFSDPKALAALNEITHRFVGQEIQRRLSEWAFNGGRIAAIDAIALIESGIGNYCKCTVGITAPTQERVIRIMKRENISREYAVLRVRAQKSNEYFENNCDFTLCNDGSIYSFHQKCKSLFDKIINNKEKTND